MPNARRAVRIALLVCMAVSALPAASAPAPLLKTGKPVDWWFVFKFNAESSPGCGGTAVRSCLLGGTVKDYGKFSQQFAFASNLDPKLRNGRGCVGDTKADPVGATANQVYSGKYFYVIWNDDFKGFPLPGKGGPYGHSKGMLAWDQKGNGVVMQVSTPSWPGSGSSLHPRAGDGNSLGCVDDNNVLVSQHFFALKLTHDDVVAVLQGLNNASVVTDVSEAQLVNNGGPADIQELVSTLGKVSKSEAVHGYELSSGVTLISKASHLNVPPWQMVSAVLDGEPLRTATWWHAPLIPTTKTSAAPGCWNTALGKPGPVDIAISGTWMGQPIGLKGNAAATGNHAKIGVSAGTHPYAIFGDMNQQGALAGDCDSSQNGRGGLFFVVKDAALFRSVSDLIAGESAPAN